jgi:hypothetical protein
VLAYTQQSVAVGELVSMVEEDGDTAVVPVVCVAEAAARATRHEADLLRLFVGLPGVTVTPLPVDVAVDMGELARAVGAIGTAHAVTEARGHGAQVATREPETMAKVLPPDWGILVI